MDLRDLWRGDTLSPRYVLQLVEHLPGDSATHASMKGGAQHRPWTLEAYLLAHTVNLLAGANHQRAGKKMRKTPVMPPKPRVKQQDAAAKKKSGRVVRIADIGARRALARQINESHK